MLLLIKKSPIVWLVSLTKPPFSPLNFSKVKPCAIEMMGGTGVRGHIPPTIFAGALPPGVSPPLQPVFVEQDIHRTGRRKQNYCN